MLDHVSVGDRVIELIGEILAGRSIARAVEVDEDLRFDVGLTSLDMMNLMLAIESSFALEIPEKNITPANFRSVRAISSLIAKLR
jgi:acyl carrier protein